MKILPVFASTPVNDIANNSMVPAEVKAAAKHWITEASDNWVLIGGLALAFYTRPRMTSDVDGLFLARSDMPSGLEHFKRTRPGAMLHLPTHVEVETLTAESVHLPQSVVAKVFSTAVTHNNYKVASLEGMIVLKLYATDNRKRELKDGADIVAMLEANPALTIENLSAWQLTSTHMARFEDYYERAHS